MVTDESYITSSFFFDVTKETYLFLAYIFYADIMDLSPPETLF
jgi:hypothetical protein